MDGASKYKNSGPADTARTITTAQTGCDAANAVGALSNQLGRTDYALICLFATARADLVTTLEALSRDRPGCPMIACTTAGEIGAQGYEDGQIIAIGFPSTLFKAQVICGTEASDMLAESRAELAQEAPYFPHHLAIAMHTAMHDAMTGGAGPTPELDDVPTLWVQADGGAKPARMAAALDGRVTPHSTVIALMRSRCPVVAFGENHLRPTADRMVVTQTDATGHVVRDINAEPAAREYARILGLAAPGRAVAGVVRHPVLVRKAGRYHVHHVRRIADHDGLEFCPPLGVGAVLTRADAAPMTTHL
ncbi:MAG: FIST N-terminal domain-containing protein, partial [Primorskyibacter sp.]